MLISKNPHNDKVIAEYQEYNFIKSLVSSKSSITDLLKEHGPINNRETIRNVWHF